MHAKKKQATKTMFLNRARLITNHASRLFVLANQSGAKQTKICAILSCKSLLSMQNSKTIASSSSSSSSDNKSNYKNAHNRPETPIRKLLRAKDIVDFFFMAFLGTGLYMGYTKYNSAKQIEKDLDIHWVEGEIGFFKKMFTCRSSDRYLPEFLAKCLPSIKSFKMRKSDVWIVSFPKSGTMH